MRAFAASIDFSRMGLPSGDAGLRGEYRLLQDAVDDVRILVQEERELLVHQGLHDALHLRIAQLALGLAFELGVRDLYGKDGREAFADVVAREGLIHLFCVLGLLEILVEGAREGGLETDEVGAALSGVDVVDEGEHVLVEAVVVLDRALDLDVVPGRFDVDRLLVEHRLVLVEVLDEALHAAFEDELVGLRGGQPLVPDRYLDTLVEEGELPQPVCQDVKVVGSGLEDSLIGLEPYRRAPLVRVADDLDRLFGDADQVFLKVDLSFQVHVRFAPGREGVDDRYADAVETAGHLVGLLVEFAARVQLGHDQLEGAHAFGRMYADRYSAAVVLHPDDIVLLKHDDDIGAVSLKGFVHRIVDHFVDEVVQPVDARRTDVHAWALANSLKALEDLNALSRIA